MKKVKRIVGMTALVIMSCTLTNCMYNSSFTPSKEGVSPIMRTSSPKGNSSPTVYDLPSQSQPTKTDFIQFPTPTKTQLHPTSTPFLFSALQPGEYLIYYYSIDRKENYVGIRSVDKGFEGVIAKDLFRDDTVLSPDLKYLPFVHHESLLLEPFWLNIQTRSYWSAPTLKHCSQPEWSPDSQYIVVSCSNDDEAGRSLYLSSPFTDTLSLLTDCYQTRDHCAFPNWSPDGQWIAYARGPAYSGSSPTSGMYLIAAECYPNADRCDQIKQGPYDVSPPFAWSPDSTQLATIGREGNSIVIYQVTDNEIHLSRQINLGEDVSVLMESLLWSPDGKRLAYSTSKGDKVYLLSLDDERLEYLFSADYVKLSNWVVVP